MKGLITRAVAAACLGGGFTLGTGCACYRDLVDTCYPERYNAMARQEVNETFGAQVNNGHVLDQTVWNYHFEKGTAKLTPMGEMQLAYLARRRPSPDPKVFLQTAQDVPYDPANPADFVRDRAKLDGDRIQVVLTYLQAQTAGRPVPFDVTVHDPADSSISAQRLFRYLTPGEGAVLEMTRGYKGILPLTTGAGASSVSGGGGTR
jgi:hypothetical protein